MLPWNALVRANHAAIAGVVRQVLVIQLIISRVQTAASCNIRVHLRNNAVTFRLVFFVYVIEDGILFQRWRFFPVQVIIWPGTPWYNAASPRQLFVGRRRLNAPQLWVIDAPWPRILVRTVALGLEFQLLFLFDASADFLEVVYVILGIF